MAPVLVIVSISPHLARAEADKCADPGPDMVKFHPALPPRPSPQIAFFDAEGNPLTVSAFKGRGVVMNFWATWCPPCIREMPALSRLKDAVAEDGITVLTLSEDRGGAKVAGKFLERVAITNLDILIDKKGKVSRKLGVGGLPTTILIDADGIEQGRVSGVAAWDSPGAIAFLKRCIGP